MNDAECKGLRWSTSDDHILIAELERGGDYKARARQRLGRTEAGIDSRVRQLAREGRVPRPLYLSRIYRATWIPSEDKQLRELRAQGFSSVEIAEQLGRTPEAVKARCKALNISAVKGRPTAIRPTPPTRPRPHAKRASFWTRLLRFVVGGQYA